MRPKFSMPVIITMTLILWEAMGRISYRVAILLSFPSRLYEYLCTRGLGLLTDLGYTASVAFVGFVFAIVTGLILGIASFRFPTLRRVIFHALQIFQVVPVLVFAPFVTMICGVGFISHAIIAYLVGTFPFTTVFLDALTRIPEPYTDLVRLHRIPFMVAMRHAFIPLSASAAFAGGRVTVALCLVGATVAEFTGARFGLGKNVFEAAIRLEPELLMLSTLAIVLVGVLGVASLRIVEHRLVNWKP